jgi:hypothetical protein
LISVFERRMASSIASGRRQWRRLMDAAACWRAARRARRFGFRDERFTASALIVSFHGLSALAIRIPVLLAKQVISCGASI